ncbi:hypothetical protein TCAL_00380 [Tigriopus californicus]|uniref:RING-type domain-containing protein n=1 Tax=Tigriopus californicus TaxID=6832 RepID=A0A553NBH8_TIGCA|nr:hypothetical protein TCAL_00380 [Tigriopus californicus]|eukprot:TCALIF_00380-PA protein Name:"Similar to RING finger protein C14orf164 homolog (Pongo abelii)" AED:0.13 eAED:0.13 QI:0/-1/0/1/-1/1/1/0/223
MDLFWIHCNECVYLPESGATKQIFLTNCGHVFCEECVPLRNSPAKCPMCQAHPLKCIELGASMKADVAKMFQDPVEKIKALFKSVQFQNGHAGMMQQNQEKRFSACLGQLKSVSVDLESTKQTLQEIKLERDAAVKERDELLRMTSETRPNPALSSTFLSPDKNLGGWEAKSSTFGNMTVNAFSAKTPAALKVGSLFGAESLGKAPKLDVKRSLEIDLGNFPF